MMRALAIVLALGAVAWMGAAPADAKPRPPGPRQPGHAPHAAQVGKASVYSKRFTGRHTASGQPFDPRRPTAASRTLPLGSTATVTNLNNGKSTSVEVTDRGPNVPGRIIDVSPKAAEDLEIGKAGTAPVEVEPVTGRP